MIEQYIAREIDCKCGKKHRSRVDTVVIKQNVIQNELVLYLKQNGYKHIVVVCDKQSYRVAGKNVCAALISNGIDHKLHLFTAEPLVPNEFAIGNLAMGLNCEYDLILAVGSGTINDVCRYVSAVAGKPFCTVGTAPSMDGYISGGSALVFNSLKLNFETHTPRAVFFEPEILANAPKDMIASGAGDLLGKISCLSDWSLSELITGEWHCDLISGIVNSAIEKTISARNGLANGESDAAAILLEALLLSGVCMDYAGNSRPASGCEHHMSHFWEMRYLLEGRKAVFHGTKVGIGTVISLKAYEYVSELAPNFFAIKNLKRQSFEEWEKAIRASFLIAADDVVALEKKCGKNSEEKLALRLAVIEEKWDKIKNFASNVTKPCVVHDILKQLGAPTKPDEIGVDKIMAKEAIMYAKDLRDRYTVLQLLWDLGELEKFADAVIEEYYGI